MKKTLIVYSLLQVAIWANTHAQIVTTVAGSASTNQLDLPTAVCLDTFGNIYVADYGNTRILGFMPNSNSSTEE